MIRQTNLEAATTFLSRAAACVAFLLLVSGCAQEDQRKPNWQEIRSFRVSQMTDSEIRKLRADAEFEYQHRVEEQKEMADSFWKERADIQAKCIDVVFKARNEAECNQPLPLGWQGMAQLPAGSQNADEIFESMIMGPCDIVETEARAREWGCLPKLAKH